MPTSGGNLSQKFFVRAADTVDATESLDQSKRVPMQVVVDNRVTILHVQAFGKHIRRDDGIQFRFTCLGFVIGMGEWRESPHKTEFALRTGPSDNVNVGPIALVKVLNR